MFGIVVGPMSPVVFVPKEQDALSAVEDDNSSGWSINGSATLLENTRRCVLMCALAYNESVRFMTQVPRGR